MRRRQPSILERVLRSFGLALCLLLIILWIVSESGEIFGYFSPTGSTYVKDGEICQPFHDRLPASLTFASGWCLLDRGAAPATSDISIPIWMPLLMVGIPTFILWGRYRSRPLGHCQNCGYDLTGNTSGVCPECGEAI